MFGTVREDFFTGLSTLIVDEGERQKFRSIYLDAPARAAFERNETERIMECFVQFPKEDKGRYGPGGDEYGLHPPTLGTSLASSR